MNVTTSDRLKQIMAERGLRQADILEMISPYCKKYDVSLPRNALSQYVAGKVLPKQDKLFILSMALDVSVVWLMGYDVPMERKAEPGKGAEGSSLTQPEAELVSCYRQLNRAGRDMLLSTARAFAGNPDMTEEKENAQAM